MRKKLSVWLYALNDRILRWVEYFLESHGYRLVSSDEIADYDKDLDFLYERSMSQDDEILSRIDSIELGLMSVESDMDDMNYELDDIVYGTPV